MIDGKLYYGKRKSPKNLLGFQTDESVDVIEYCCILDEMKEKLWDDHQITPVPEYKCQLPVGKKWACVNDEIIGEHSPSKMIGTRPEKPFGVFMPRTVCDITTEIVSWHDDPKYINLHHKRGTDVEHLQCFTYQLNERHRDNWPKPTAKVVYGPNVGTPEIPVNLETKGRLYFAQRKAPEEVFIKNSKKRYGREFCCIQEKFATKEYKKKLFYPTLYSIVPMLECHVDKEWACVGENLIMPGKNPTAEIDESAGVFIPKSVCDETTEIEQMTLVTGPRVPKKIHVQCFNYQLEKEYRQYYPRKMMDYVDGLALVHS